MSRRKKISDLPIPGFDRAIRSSFNSAFSLLSATIGLGYSVYKNATSANHYPNSYYYNCNAGNDSPISQSLYTKSQFKNEISQIEKAIDTNRASIKQCERLGKIYSLIGDPFKERYAHMCAIKCFLVYYGLDSIVDSVIASFNDPCKRPVGKISEDETINAKYLELLNKAEAAKRKCHLKILRK